MNLRPFAITAAVMAFMAFGASSASATTLEVGGVTQSKAVTIQANLKSGTSAILSKTDGSEANTCSASSLKTTTGYPYTGHTVTAVTSNLEYFWCGKLFTVHKAGVVHLTYIAATLATVTFSQTEWTIGTSFGFNVTCSTGAGTHVGTLTGVASGSATLDINAVLNCGFLLPSATFKATYTVSSPSGLGVTA